MVFNRKTLVLPDNTIFQDGQISAHGDVIIGDRSLMQFGIQTDGRIFVGEHVITSGDLQSQKDIRVDIFSTIGGNITSKGNVYLGEKVSVQGKLSLDGDLDVGDNVDIQEGFEAKGWINIRSPIPMIIYVFIYLLQLLKMGHSEEIERLLNELEENEGEPIPISETFLFIPNNAIIGASKSQIDCHIHIGSGCKIVGNYTGKGDGYISDNSQISGSLSCTGDMYCGKNVVIQGNITTEKTLYLNDKVTVHGNISAERVEIAKSAVVKGTIHAKKGVTFIDPSADEATRKVKRFEADTDVVDEVKELLE